MNGPERGFLLLTSHLGNPERNPLSVAQFRQLAQRIQQNDALLSHRELRLEDIIALGYDKAYAKRVLALLSEEELLDHYLARGKRYGCVPVVRSNPAYPVILRKRLGLDAPGCIWAKGDLSLLDTQMIALVGSRDLQLPNREFAAAVGMEAARQGITLVSGNARGADQVAQNACLQAGGKVISVVADQLKSHKIGENILYLSEDSFDLPFSPLRALSRNRVIHGLGYLTIVAQCSLKTGGTWDGTVKNLRGNWSPVFAIDDSTPATRELEQLGATRITPEQLCDFGALQSNINSFL